MKLIREIIVGEAVEDKETEKKEETGRLKRQRQICRRKLERTVSFLSVSNECRLNTIYFWGYILSDLI